MKKKARIWLLVLSIQSLLLIFGVANAKESVSLEQLKIEASEGWRASYNTSYGELKIDIPVTVPDVTSLPIMRLRALTSAAIPEQKATTVYPFDNGNASIYNFSGILVYQSPDHEEYVRIQKNAPPQQDLSIQGIVVSANDIIANRSYAIGNTATLEDANAMRDRIVQQFFPELDISFQVFRLEADTHAKYLDPLTGMETGEEWAEYCGAMHVEYNQLIRGIPFISTIERAFKQPLGKMESQVFSRYLNSFVRIQPMKHYGADSTFCDTTLCLLQEVGTLTENMRLCSLQKVKETYGSLIEKGLLLRVDSLQLGYVGWYLDASSDEMVAIPMWVAQGVLLRKPITRDQQNVRDINDYSIRDAEYSLIMVNPQTGELIDNDREDRNRSYDAPIAIQ